MPAFESAKARKETVVAYKVDAQARYAQSHEWARIETGKVAVVGISDYAQHLLSDVVYVELPSVGDSLTKGESFATVESVKSAEDAYAPVSGTVVAVNNALEANPEGLNADPFGAAWLVKVELADQSELEQLMDAAVYERFVSEQEGEDAH
jgi:glycine cleavage system H protein